MSMKGRNVDVQFNKIRRQTSSNTQIHIETQLPQRMENHFHNHNFRNKNQGANRAKTSSKQCVSSPFVQDEQHLQRSAIEELQLLDYGLPNTQHVLQSKKTFQQFNIRKSISLDKEKIELSFSSQYIDLETQNLQLKKRIEDLEKQIKCFAEIEQKINLQIDSDKKQIQYFKYQLDCSEKQAKKGQLEIHQQKGIIQNKDSEIVQLKCKLDQANKFIAEFSFNNQRLKKNAQNQKQALSKSHIKKLQSLQQQHQLQINIFENQFNLAKTIGQQQIDHLLNLLQQKQKQIHFLKATIRLKNSTHISSTPSQTKQEKYMNRFKKFVNMIDRKLYSSQNKQSSLFSKTVVTHSAIQQKKRNIKKDYFTKLDQKKSQFLQPQRMII